MLRRRWSREDFDVNSAVSTGATADTPPSGPHGAKETRARRSRSPLNADEGPRFLSVPSHQPLAGKSDGANGWGRNGDGANAGGAGTLRL
ncbi:unnamed protein product [Lampetra fluviatilis]